MTTEANDKKYSITISFSKLTKEDIEALRDWDNRISISNAVENACILRLNQIRKFEQTRHQ